MSALRRRQLFQMMHLNLEALNKERYQLLLQALTKERKQKKRKASMLMIRLLHPRNLQPWNGMIMISLEMNLTQFLGDYLNVFLMVTIQFGQVFTILDFQHFQPTNTWCGTRSIVKQLNLMQWPGLRLKRSRWWTLTSNVIMMNRSWRFLRARKGTLSTVAQTLDFTFESGKMQTVLQTLQLNVIKRTLNLCLISVRITYNTTNPYSVILQLLAMRYLGAGVLDAEYLDLDYPHRSSKSLSCMFWNLGNWQRKTHSKNWLPEHLEKFRPNIRFDLNTDHEPSGDKPFCNRYFVSAIKNLRAHIFLNCEASSLYENRARLEELGWNTRFNDFANLMCAARLGKDGYIKQIAGYSTDDKDTKPRFVSWAIFEIVWGKTISRSTNEEEPLARARMTMNRVCIYHVGQNHVSCAAAMCGEVIARICWECVRFEVDIIAGDGSKAAYYCTPKSPGVPMYECSFAPVLDWQDGSHSNASSNQKFWAITKGQSQTLCHLFIQWFSAS